TSPVPASAATSCGGTPAEANVTRGGTARGLPPVRPRRTGADCSAGRTVIEVSPGFGWPHMGRHVRGNRLAREQCDRRVVLAAPYIGAFTFRRAGRGGGRV